MFASVKKSIDKSLKKINNARLVCQEVKKKELEKKAKEKMKKSEKDLEAGVDTMFHTTNAEGHSVYAWRGVAFTLQIKARDGESVVDSMIQFLKFKNFKSFADLINEVNGGSEAALEKLKGAEKGMEEAIAELKKSGYPKPKTKKDFAKIINIAFEKYMQRSMHGVDSGLEKESSKMGEQVDEPEAGPQVQKEERVADSSAMKAEFDKASHSFKNKDVQDVDEEDKLFGRLGKNVRGKRNRQQGRSGR